MDIDLALFEAGTNWRDKCLADCNRAELIEIIRECREEIELTRGNTKALAQLLALKRRF